MSKNRSNLRMYKMIYTISNNTIRRLRHIAWLAGLMAVLVSLLAGCAQFNAPGTAEEDMPSGSYRGTRIDPPQELADFTLTSHTGAPLRLSDLRGRPVLLFFGYTNCPDICPTTLGEWKQVKARLGDSAGQVAFVFVGVDSKRDTPAAMARFVRKFDPAFVGLSGDEGAIRAAGKEFGLYFQPHAAGTSHGGDLVDHSSASYLIDPDGRLQMVYSYGVPADVISGDIRKLL